MAPPQWPSTWRCSNPRAPIAGRAARGSDPPQPGPRGSQGDRPLGSKNGGISTGKMDEFGGKHREIIGEYYGSTGKMAKLWTKWWISMEELGNSVASIYGTAWEHWGINVGNIWKTWEN